MSAKAGIQKYLKVLDSGSRQRRLRVLLSSLLADELPNRFVRGIWICRKVMVSLPR
jgi:hypothetical protein